MLTRKQPTYTCKSSPSLPGFRLLREAESRPSSSAPYSQQLVQVHCRLARGIVLPTSTTGTRASLFPCCPPKKESIRQVRSTHDHCIARTAEPTYSLTHFATLLLGLFSLLLLPLVSSFLPNSSLARSLHQLCLPIVDNSSSNQRLIRGHLNKHHLTSVAISRITSLTPSFVCSFAGRSSNLLSAYSSRHPR
ncbi:6,7-dimethyl-8-ribityllumazine synthase [Fusarium oxysporum f. sp. albedinis]|nr:6,7-dimethyl-8-ribityllumazine synthase [Fusarium oxysporum f. sp. albedinis]